MTDSQNIPWKRLVAEAAAIVVSILIAFGIDAWWDVRELREEEQVLLAIVLEGAESSLEALTGVREIIQRDRDALRLFFTRPESELASVPADSVGTHLIGLMRASGTERLSLGPLAGIASSGQVSLIRDSEVRARLDEWLLVLNDFEDVGRNGVAAERTAIEALARNESFRERLLVGVENDSRVDLRPIRNDTDVRTAAASVEYQRRIAANFLPRLVEVLNRIEERVTAISTD